jgi:hypothetical protein
MKVHVSHAICVLLWVEEQKIKLIMNFEIVSVLRSILVIHVFPPLFVVLQLLDLRMFQIVLHFFILIMKFLSFIEILPDTSDPTYYS